VQHQEPGRALGVELALGGLEVDAPLLEVAADGSLVTLVADSFNVQAGWRYLPVPEARRRTRSA
jgi:hypothetical protein